MIGISNEELRANMSRFLGREVILIGDHPACGEHGWTERLDTKEDGEPVMVVKLKNGGECIVTDARQCFFPTF